MALSIFSHFRYAEDHFDDILAHFEQQKVEDGGWNCRNQRTYTPKTKHFSLNTTISVLEGLASLEKNYPRYSGRVKKLRVLLMMYY